MKKQIFVSLMLFGYAITATSNPSRIHSKVDYAHEHTGMVFPLVLENFDRTDITAFDRKRENIGANYDNKAQSGNTKITVYLYPAGEGTEDRLRSGYSACLQSIAHELNENIYATQYAVVYKNSGYTVNGYKADLKDRKEKSSLSLYECGHWFFKIRITSGELDSAGMNETEQKNPG